MLYDSLSSRQFGTSLWPPRESAPWDGRTNHPQPEAAEEAVVKDRIVEQPTVVGEAVVDQQLQAQHVVGFEGGIHNLEREGSIAKNSPKKNKSSSKNSKNEQSTTIPIGGYHAHRRATQ